MEINTMVQIFGRQPGLVQMLEEKCYARDNCIIRYFNEHFKENVSVNRGYHRNHAFVQLCVEGKLKELALVLDTAAKSAEDKSLSSKVRHKAILVLATYKDALNCLNAKVQKLYPGQPLPDKVSLEKVWDEFAAKHSAVAQKALAILPSYHNYHEKKHEIQNQEVLDACSKWDRTRFQEYFNAIESQHLARSLILAFQTVNN